jgi:D-glycero-alpha-D-manno-heptose-7-phosphate kinase
VSVQGSAGPGDGTVTVDATDYGVAFTVGAEPPEHRLLAEAIREAGAVGPLDVQLRVTSAVPPASSLGTSGAVCVGLIAALDALRGDVRPAPALAAAAHRAEAGRLGRQSGVQDQLAAAHGGANVFDVPGYPDASARPVAVSAVLAIAIDQQLAHIAYGSAHDSSEVHEEVIAVLEGEGPSAPRLEQLRRLADRAGHALAGTDVDAYGAVLTAATDAQAALHPALVSEAAHELIDLARSCGAAGWKVNGAGGGGGSISILVRRPSDRDLLVERARQLGHTPLPLTFSRRGAHARRGGPG